MLDAKPQRRWFRLTPDRCLVASLALVGFLFLSERFRWFAFNEKKGWTVLIAVASVGVALLLVALWFAASLVFRWRFQFSIRSLLVLVVVVSIPCSWLAVEMREAEMQRRAVEELQNVGGTVGYSDNSNPSMIWFNGPPPGPGWLRNLLGDDFFANVTDVSFVFGDTTDAVLANCKDLNQLQTLWLGASAHVGPRSNEELNRPRKHFLLNAQLTDAGLTNLAGLTQLQSLDLSESNVTDEGVAKLQKALPNCRIEH